jgi:hypothetical protein
MGTLMPPPDSPWKCENPLRVNGWEAAQTAASDPPKKILQYLQETPDYRSSTALVPSISCEPPPFNNETHEERYGAK